MRERGEGWKGNMVVERPSPGTPVAATRASSPFPGQKGGGGASPRQGSRAIARARLGRKSELPSLGGGLKTRIGDGLITLYGTFAIVRGDIKKIHMISSL